MPRKKYSSDAATQWRRLVTYPNERLFRIFVGYCFSTDYGRAELLEKILHDRFKNLTASEQEHFLKCYDDYMLHHVINNWPKSGGAAKRLTVEIIQFLYTKIKYRKVMFLNVGFSEKEYKWPIMSQVFNEIFTGCDDHKIKVLTNALNTDLQNNILAFAKEVREVKKNKAA
jgi:hypothetical protein